MAVCLYILVSFTNGVANISLATGISEFLHPIYIFSVIKPCRYKVKHLSCLLISLSCREIYILE